MDSADRRVCITWGHGVAIIAPAPPPYGGMTIQGQALRDHLATEGIKVIAIPTNPSLPYGIGKIKGVRTFLQTLVYFSLLARSIPRVSIVHILAASHFYFFARVVPAVLISRILGRRIIVNYRGGEAFRFLAQYGWLVRPVLRLAGLITVPSAYLERCFQEQGFACKVVGNPIKLDRFQFCPREHLAPRLLVTRNLEPMYNVEMALRAFQLVKQIRNDARLDIVGTGTEELKLKQWVKEKGVVDVFFHGSVPSDEMPQYLQRADILLNPTNVDNLPMNLLEAFASGLPVVSTNVGGIPDLLGGERSALLVEPGDYHAMANKVIFLLTNPDRVKLLVASARRLAEEFSWDRIREKLFEAYYCGRPDVLMPSAIEERKA